MKKNKTASLFQLPQTPESWFLSLRELSLAPESQTTRLALLLILDLTQNKAIRLDIYESLPDLEFVQQQLWNTIRQPELEGVLPHRPYEIQFEQPELLNGLAAALQNIQVATRLGDPPPMIDALIAELSQTLVSSQQELPGLLSVPEANPKMIASLFDSAIVFYHAAPWKRLIDYQTLSVVIDPPGQELYVQVMGNGGIEFGLTFYTSWEDVLRVFKHANSPMELLPVAGIHGLTFEARDDLPSEDQSGMRKYGWKTAGKRAYPLPVTFTKDGEAERPNHQHLLYFEALMRSLPEFVREYLVEDEQGDFQPVEAVMETRHFDGPVRLTIRYPAGELPNLDGEALWLDEVETSLELPEALIEANRLAGQAWEETDPEERLRLARSALAISPDCTEAYLVLAYETETPEGAQEWLEKAVQAGERTIGQEFIAAHEGDLWRWHEARPYLRACDGLAENLEALGRVEESLEGYMALLGLNDEDHQGARYNAIRLLMQLKHDEDAQDLLDDYEEDGSATWAYSKALLAFRRGGEPSNARKALKQATQTNPYVPAYLTGAKPLPAEAPEAVGIGDDTEAIQYVLEHYAIWWSTPGAVDWLKRNG
jgi:tetratricopeptide (TPR) repeat protein